MKGSILKDLRTQKGITQQALADAVGVKDSTIRMIELGKRNGSLELSSALADYFGVSMDYLEGKTEYKNADDVANNLVKRLKEMNLLNESNDITDDVVNLIIKKLKDK